MLIFNFLLTVACLTLCSSNIHIGHETKEITLVTSEGTGTLNLHCIIGGPIGASSLKGDILLLHGAKFNSGTWESLGTLRIAASNGYRVFAIDLPGYGLSTIEAPEGFDPKPEIVLLEIIKTLNIHSAIVVSPSMSGRYSLPFLVSYSKLVRAFIPIAPTIPPTWTVEQVPSSFPSLIVWGQNDTLGTRYYNS